MGKKLTKRMRKLKTNVDFRTQQYEDILDVFIFLKKMSTVKFIESVDVSIHLNMNPKKSDQNVRGSVVMPNGLGRDVFLVVLTQGDTNLKLARDFGADLVGLDDIFDQIKICQSKIDVVLASPDVMHIVTKLGPILGPRGLMPNLKMGTISQNISESVKNFKFGQVRYKNEKNGIVHASFGKLSFSPEQLKENLETLILSLNQSKPIQCKGEYIKEIFISTTMGRSVSISKNSLSIL